MRQLCVRKFDLPYIIIFNDIFYNIVANCIYADIW